MAANAAPSAAAASVPSTAKAAAWMAGWLSLMLVIAIAGREATRELSVFQLMLLRSSIGLVLIAPLVRGAGGWAVLRTQRLREHALRNAVHYAAQYAWLAALGMIALAQVVAIEFTMPIWTVLLAAAFLGERITAAKTVAVVLGLAGVTLIVRPGGAGGMGGIAPGQFVALAAALGFAVSVVMVKSLTRSDGAVAIIFWMLVIQSIIGLAPALATWRWPSPGAWGWVLLVAFCGTYSHYCMARALAHADATVVVPMDFLRVPLTALAGWLIYAERLDLLTVFGAALILGGNLLNTRRAAAR
ncbi:MAG TPA: DMT family transporter [Burkholderiaceae bacterium]|nr:DMT family transporter [Burkholderiaceae bacterium]